MFAATAAGLFKKVEYAKTSMGNGFETIYKPDEAQVEIYDKLYNRYRTLGSISEKRSIELHS
jgi:L-ribulokinase